MDLPAPMTINPRYAVVQSDYSHKGNLPFGVEVLSQVTISPAILGSSTFVDSK